MVDTRYDSGVFGTYSTVAATKSTAGVVTIPATAAAKLIANFAALTTLFTTVPVTIPDGDLMSNTFKDHLLTEIAACKVACVDAFD